MLTAGAAAMGFLPMAISTGAGAEVQRPFATVVIGGLVTSTMLTMIALPLLFEIFYNVKGIKFFPFRVIRSKEVISILILLILPTSLFSQTKTMNLNELMDIAIANNRAISAYNMKIEESRTLKATAFNIDKTVISYGTDQNNIAENGYPINVWSIEQYFNFPTLYSAEMNARKIDISKAETTLEVQKQKLKKEISLCYFEIQNLLNKEQIYLSIDSLYTSLLKSAETRNKKGDLSDLELLNIIAKQKQSQLSLKSIKYSIENAMQKLKTLMNYNSDFNISREIEILNSPENSIDSYPSVQMLKLQNTYNEAVIRIEKNKMLPDLSLNYFTGTNNYENARYYHGFQVGLAVPLFFGSQKSKIESSKISMNAQQLMAENEIVLLENKIAGYKREELKYREAIEFYNTSGKQLHDEILRASVRSFQLGEIDIFKFTSSYENAVQIKLDYLDNVLQYNTIMLEQLYLTN